MSYLDRAFCSSSKCKDECGRQFTEEHRERAKAWWGGEDFPIALGTFCDMEGNYDQVQQNSMS